MKYNLFVSFIILSNVWLASVVKSEAAKTICAFLWLLGAVALLVFSTPAHAMPAGVEGFISAVLDTSDITGGPSQDDSDDD